MSFCPAMNPRFHRDKNKAADTYLDCVRADDSQRYIAGDQHLEGFYELIRKQLKNSVNSNYEVKRDEKISDIYVGEKSWDIVVRNQKELILALDLKNISSSLSNNLTNRVGDLNNMGESFWDSFRGSDYFHYQDFPPFLGFYFVFDEKNDYTEENSKKSIKQTLSNLQTNGVFDKGAVQFINRKNGKTTMTPSSKNSLSLECLLESCTHHCRMASRYE